MPLRSASRHERTQRAIQRAALTRARRLRGGSIRQQALSLIGWQALAATQSRHGLDAMLAEQGISAPSVAPVVTSAQLGTASDGRSLTGLLRQAAPDLATLSAFDMIVLTQLQDVVRSTMATEIAARPAITGYVRQVSAGACSRCAILAGQFYRWSEGFDRHPNCNCEHVPTREGDPEGVATAPRDYFESLSVEEQDRIFTQAGAEAIRAGADPAQVVNARRGMTTAQPTVRVIGQREHHLDVAGQRITTYEPITEVVATRGRLIRDDDGLFTTSAGARGQVRLMPESILEIANGDRERALTLLQQHGYIR